MLARFAQEFLARRRARLQRVKSHALRCDLMLMTLFCLVERISDPRPLGAKLSEIAFDMAQPP